MTGPEGYNSSNTLEAEGRITPEGYDVDDLEQAIAYLRDVHGLDPALVDPRGETDLETGFHISYSLANIDRAVGPDMSKPRRQSVAEHTLNMIVMAGEIIDEYDLPYDKELVTGLIIMHDAVEIYANDTVVGNAEQEATKPYRERAGYTLLEDRYKRKPKKIALIKELKNPTLPETRFVKKSIDKVEPLYVARATKCATQIELGESFETFIGRLIPKIFRDKLILNNYALPVIHDIGRKFEKSWGGKPIGGDHIEIVQDLILAHQAKVNESEAEEDTFVGVPHERWSVHRVAQKALQAAFEERGGDLPAVVSLRDWREKRRPLPPSPTPTPATGIALAI